MNFECRRLRQGLELYVEDELTDAASLRELRRHLLTCDSCQGFLAEYDELTRDFLVTSGRVEDADGEADRSFWGRLDEERRRDRIVGALSAASRFPAHSSTEARDEFGTPEAERCFWEVDESLNTEVLPLAPLRVDNSRARSVRSAPVWVAAAVLLLAGGFVLLEIRQWSDGVQETSDSRGVIVVANNVNTPILRAAELERQIKNLRAPEPRWLLSTQFDPTPRGIQRRLDRGGVRASVGRSLLYRVSDRFNDPEPGSRPLVDSRERFEWIVEVIPQKGYVEDARRAFILVVPDVSHDTVNDRFVGRRPTRPLSKALWFLPSMVRRESLMLEERVVSQVTACRVFVYEQASVGEVDVAAWDSRWGGRVGGRRSQSELKRDFGVRGLRGSTHEIVPTLASWPERRQY